MDNFHAVFSTSTQLLVGYTKFPMSYLFMAWVEVSEDPVPQETVELAQPDVWVEQ